MKKYYSKKQKDSIIKQYLSGVSVVDLCKSSGIARSTIYSWIKESTECKKQEKRVNMRCYADLKKQCENQKLMIEILCNYRPICTQSNII